MLVSGVFLLQMDGMEQQSHLQLLELITLSADSDSAGCWLLLTSVGKLRGMEEPQPSIGSFLCLQQWSMRYFVRREIRDFYFLLILTVSVY